MANDTILTPGGEHWEEPTAPIAEGPYLERDNYLGEYDNDVKRSLVRDNIVVYSKDQVYTKVETNAKVDKSISDAFLKFLEQEDPHNILPEVQKLIEDLVKTDGTTPFTSPQRGVDPVEEFHLVTKRFVTKLLQDHIKSDDPHRILPKVEDILEQYVKASQVYFKNQVYTKDEVDQKGTQYIKKDGTTPFTKAQVGADPQIDSHLATKRYVDKVLYQHLVDIDPHGFIQILNSRLAGYAKANNVWDKTQTYSRSQVDAIVRSLVGSAAQEVLNDHLNQFDPHHILDEVHKERFVKQDGSIPFRNPQKGVDAVDPQDLVTLHQVEEKVAEAEKKIDSIPAPVWITSGDVQSTVGHVEDNSPVPPTMTFQEIMDAIFYGKTVSIDVPEYVVITKSCEVTVCIHGSLGLLQYAELYQNGELIYTFTKEQFEEAGGCITVDSKPLLDDSEFTFKAYYTTGAVLEDSKTVKCYMPLFVGLLPKWKQAYTITMDYLLELCNEDQEGTQNRFVNQGKELDQFTFHYKFEDPKLRHPFLVVPASYPELKMMKIEGAQSFGIEAFDIVNAIPLQVPGVDRDIIFTVYVYRQALSNADWDFTFKFKKPTEP